MIQVNRWEIVIGGYRQHEGDPTGPLLLWSELLSLCSPTTQVVFREWNAPWDRLADVIHRTSVSHPTIRIYAYSWGCGYGFLRLAKELKRRGLKVDVAVLCDPVYHSHLLLFRWLAFIPGMTLWVPSNVHEVRGVAQSQSCLRGHRVKAVDPKATRVHQFVRLHRDHTWMDDSPLFHSMCLTAAGVRQ